MVAGGSATGGRGNARARTLFFTSPHPARHLLAPGQLLLARLGHQERTGPDITAWYIGAHHNAGGRNLRANEAKRRWLGGLAKEALAAPKHHWKSPHVVLIDQ